VIRWDFESVNTCPENYRFSEEKNYLIEVEATGLYELTLAFFSKK
jgi:hypothetical protein